MSKAVASRAAAVKSQGGHGRAQHRVGQAAVSLLYSYRSTCSLPCKTCDPNGISKHPRSRVSQSWHSSQTYQNLTASPQRVRSRGSAGRLHAYVVYQITGHERAYLLQPHSCHGISSHETREKALARRQLHERHRQVLSKGRV